MDMEANKATARRFVDEVVSRGNLALIDELLAPDFVDHSASPGSPPTREGTKTFMAMLGGAFPDLHVTIDDVIAEGDRVVLRTTNHGTMKGEFAGMPPSGKSATWASVHIVRFANGKQVEHWAVVDQLSATALSYFASVRPEIVDGLRARGLRTPVVLGSPKRQRSDATSAG